MHLVSRVEKRVTCAVMRHVSPVPAELSDAIAQLFRTEVGAALRELVGPTIERVLVSRPRPCRCAEPDFYTVQQARDRLAVSNSTFYRMAKRGEIKLLKRGRSTLIARAEIDALVARLKGEIEC
jgi:excisionase family DNA binding protein